MVFSAGGGEEFEVMPLLQRRNTVTGRFATLPVCHHGSFATTLDDSLTGRFTTWTFRTFERYDTRTFHYLPGRFATGRQRLANINCRLFECNTKVMTYCMSLS